MGLFKGFGLYAMPLNLSKLKINIKREINKMKLGNLDKAILGLKKGILH